MPKTNDDRHLNRLPQKSFKVASGDVIGGMVYIMDKPLGVEEGMIGMSIDSQPYRDFIENIVENISEAPTKLQQRYSDIIKGDFDFSLLTEENKNIFIDLLMHDPKILEYVEGIVDVDKKKAVQSFIQIYLRSENLALSHAKHRHPLTLKEIGKLFSPSKMHEFKGGQSYYINQGLGGLMLRAYQAHCGVKKKEHFASKIQKMIYDGKKDPPEKTNDIYMVKQDGELRIGNKTGPGFRKRLKTTAGKKQIAPLLHPLAIVATLGLSALVGFAILTVTSRKSTTLSSNSDAITETIATKVAEVKGMNTQSIEIIDGTYENGLPKMATVVKWSPGCRDLTGRLTGSDNFEDVMTVQGKHGEEIRVDSKNNLLVKKTDKETKTDIYEQVSKDGKTRTPISSSDFDAGFAVSEDRIAGLGESIIPMLSAGDRDGIGKKGQNKAIIPLDPPVDNQIYQFYGIDYGKAYITDNPIVDSLSDDFSFENLEGMHSKFVNYSIMYDNPLREKMKGVYLLAALRGQLVGEAKQAIINDYKNGNESDKKFAEKLENHPKDGVADADLKLIEELRADYLAKAVIEKDSTRKAEYLEHAEKLKKIHKIVVKTDETILSKFESRMHLTPTQIDILENMEKLTATKAKILSPNGKVQLNHIRVDRKDRIAWQFNDAGQLVSQPLTDETKGAVGQKIINFKEKLKEIAQNNPTDAENINSLLRILNEINLNNSPIVVPKLSEDQFTLLHQHLNEENVAATREDCSGFRTQKMRDDFHKRLKSLHANAPNKSKEKRPTIESSSIVHKADLDENPLRLDRADFLDRPDSVPSNTQWVEPLKRKPVGLMFSNPLNLEDESIQAVPLATQSQSTLENLYAYLEKADNAFHHIDRVEPLQTGTYLKFQVSAIHFKDPNDPNNSAKKATAYAQKSDNDSITYATNTDVEDANFKYAAIQICRLAVFSAQPNAEFRISPDLPLERQAILQEAFEAAIQEACTPSDKVPNPPFTNDNKPHVKEQEKAKHLFTAAPSA
jgi:hypothetical protein